MKPVTTTNAPTPAGHYSQGMIHNGLVFVSGQVAIDPATGERTPGSIEEQTLMTLQNVKGVLEAAGSSLDRVLKTTVFVTSIDHWDAVNKVYAEFFGDHKPARAIIPSRDLHYGFLIEIEAIATV